MKNNPAFLLFLFFLISCQGNRNPYLALFFDGVEKTDKITKVEPEIKTDKNNEKIPKELKNEEVFKSAHKPFSEQKCNKCHDMNSNRILQFEGMLLCFACHKKELFTGKYDHGPVAAGECGSCHLPHQSKFPKLLKKEGNLICLSCHLASDLSSRAEHGSKMGCLDCHLPHSGNNRYFLKNSI